MNQLAFDDVGEGTPVVLLHGLTATRRYVVMGSRTLERGGHRVIAYDARGHGASPPAATYGYEELAEDLRGLLDRLSIDRAVLAGASMGAHTLLRLALDSAERVAGMVVITPAFDPEAPRQYDRWDALSEGLRSGGVDGFIAAYGEPSVPPQWRDTVLTVLRQRLARHEHPEAVADALREVPRSRPFASWSDLASLCGLPCVVVGDRDEADPGHPLATAERYAAELGAPLVVEEEGASPIAWSGSRLSKVIAGVASP